MISCPSWVSACGEGTPSRLHPGSWPGLLEEDSKPCGWEEGQGCSPAEGQGTPPHPHWEGGATAPRPRVQGPDWPGREAALGPFSTILSRLCLPSSQAAPRTLGRGLGKVWSSTAVPRAPGALRPASLPVRTSLGAEAAVPRFCAYLLGGDVGEELSGLGDTLV